MKSQLSTVSRTTEAVVVQRKMLLSGKFGPFDFLFPLYDDLTQKTRIWQIIYIIQMIFIQKNLKVTIFVICLILLFLLVVRYIYRKVKKRNSH